MRLSLLVLALVTIAIREFLDTCTVLQEVVKLACVCANTMPKGALPMLPVVLPVALIEISLGRVPGSMSIFHTILPVSFEYLSIVPLEYAVPFPHVVLVASNVYAINVSLEANPFLVESVCSLEYLFLRYV